MQQQQARRKLSREGENQKWYLLIRAVYISCEPHMKIIDLRVQIKRRTEFYSSRNWYYLKMAVAIIYYYYY